MPNKAVAAGGAAAISGAIVTIILSLFSHPLAADVQGALTTLVNAGVAFLAAWLAKYEGAGA